MSAAEPGNRPIHRRVIYEGRVQGVGFRYTCAKIARRYQVGGYVKNLPSGDVELDVFGAEAIVRQYLSDVADAFSGNIERTSTTELEPAGSALKFRIEH